MVIITETNHTVKIHTIGTHHSMHNHRTKVNEIQECSECSSDCTDLSDCEEKVNTETPDNTKN